MPEKVVSLELNVNEAVAILNLLGSVPTNQQAYPLWLKVVEQVKAQAPEAF